MTKRYSRPLTGIERGLLLSAQICPPFANQVLIEGEGVLNKAHWQSAIEKASEANPGSRLVLSGGLKFSQWIDSGKAPQLREVDGTNWTGFDQEGAPFLLDKLSSNKGPTCEVLLVKGTPQRILFRTLHAVMDGHGTMTWMEDIFRALRGEKIIGSDSPITAVELAQSFQDKPRTGFPNEHIAPTGKAKGDEQGTLWRRIKFNGIYSHIMAKVAVLMAQEARRHANGDVRFDIPVDMRRRKKKLRSTGNLTNSIHLDVSPDATPRELAANIVKQLYERRDGMLPKESPWHDFIPLWFMRLISRNMIKKYHTKGRYGLTGVISNLGRLPINQYEGGGFRATTGFFVPPNMEYIPFFMTFTEVGKTTEMALSMPRVLGNEGRLDGIIEYISKSLMLNDE